MRKKEFCKKCNREYDGSYPCPDCGSKEFACGGLDE
jgi:RNA polymerase subunit RPABC4/transcription elongation factor Spt4